MPIIRERRGNVRAGLRAKVRMMGTDKLGRAFDVSCESLDYSRRGLGLLLEKDIVNRGDVVSVEVRRRLHAGAVVRWVRFDASLNRVRVGLRLIDPRASLRFRISSAILIVLAVLIQGAVGKTRWGSTHLPSATRCRVSAEQMKVIIHSALAQPGMITDSEKSFVRLKHEERSCGEYTRLFEQTNYYRTLSKREAMMKWHWEVYHSQTEGAREPAQSSEGAISGGR